jgi:DNA polymerase/3'-5' exonuclease PolX
MTTQPISISLKEAIIVGKEAMSLLEDVCESCEFAGSIRREKPFVGDIELLIVPKVEERPDGLFGDLKPVNLQFERIQKLIDEGVFEHRRSSIDTQCCGPRFQRLLYKGIPIDLFCVLPPAQYGVLMVIRTGSKRFSQSLMTPKHKGGKMPFGMRVDQGVLWDRGKALETPTEKDFFDQLGVPWREPCDRS